MEDLKRECEGEPTDTQPNHETRPPKRPEKIPPIERADTPQWDQSQTDSSHNQLLPNKEARSSDAALPNPDTADVVVSKPYPRSAPLWAFPTFQVLHPMWQQLFSRGGAPTVYRGTQQAYQGVLAQSPAQTRDDIDLSKSQRSRDRDGEHTLRREMELMRMQLREANNRADQAERAAEELRRQLKSRSREMAVDKDDASDDITALKAETKGLKVELDEARSHIFSLQPYRKDVTPKEVGQDFDDLVHGITDWVTNLIEPILDDEDKIEEVLAAAKKRPTDIQKLKRYLHSQGDLVYGSVFPETDIDILIAVVMRFLQDHIFQKILCGAMPAVVEVLTFVEGSMQNNVEPKRDLFALRSWRAEALNAVICSPDYQRARYGRIRELTMEVATLFKVFKKEKDWNKLCFACQEEIIKPAVQLHEKLMTSTHHFYLDLNTYVVWNSPQSLEMSPDFMDDLPTLKCENILQNRKPFNVTKLEPRPTKEQLYRDLTNVATIVPALYMRQVGKGDIIKEPAVVRPQQMLVAWGPQEKRDRFVENGERPVLHNLCFSRDKQERAEGGVGQSWAQWRNLQWG